MSFQTRIFVLCFPNIKLKQAAKLRNRYNQEPQLTRDTIWESDKTQENTTHKGAKRSTIFPADDLMSM